MTNDPELLEAFAQEVDVLMNELGGIVGLLKTNIEQPQLFAKFGQVIDRIYGTAATMGFSDLASYSGALKKTCYDASVTTNKRAYSRVLPLLESCLNNLSTLKKSINNPSAVQDINRALHLDIQRTKKLFEDVFQFDKKKAAI